MEPQPEILLNILRQLPTVYRFLPHTPASCFAWIQALTVDP